MIMRVFADKRVKRLFLAIAAVMAALCAASQLLIWLRFGEVFVPLLILSLIATGALLALCFSVFAARQREMENAVATIHAFLDGRHDARIACDDEGELNRLFHAVNTLATVLSAHAENEIKAREFLKGTISDISHQLKTPLAALNIYNGLIQEEAAALPAIGELASLSEKELDRIDALVQNLLKITKLDAGTIAFEKATENVSDMMREVELRFAHRAKQEKKELAFSGDEELVLLCDRGWLCEAIANLVKNALDHTDEGGHVWVEWRRAAHLAQITVKDDGQGIHPEDIHHIFKRFYRSRFAKDTQGIGLGLPLAKAIVEAHGGGIAVDSVFGEGAAFTLSFLIPTKL